MATKHHKKFGCELAEAERHYRKRGLAKEYSSLPLLEVFTKMSFFYNFRGLKPKFLTRVKVFSPFRLSEPLNHLRERKEYEVSLQLFFFRETTDTTL